jgi:hypothetical protein
MNNKRLSDRNGWKQKFRWQQSPHGSQQLSPPPPQLLQSLPQDWRTGR